MNKAPLIKLSSAKKQRIRDAGKAIDLMNKSKSKFVVVPRNVRELIRDKRKWFFIRNEMGEKIGTVSLDLKKGEIGGFSVLPKYRGLKNSLPALKKAEGIMKKAGHKKAILHININSERTIKLLEILGYAKGKKLFGEKYGVKFNLIELEKKLD